MSEDNKTAVVTGATGMIGIALIKHLVQNNYTVYAVVRPDSERIKNIPVHERIVIVSCDINSYSSLPEKIGRCCDLFFHLAWDGTYGNSRNNMHLQTNNILASVEAAETASKLGCSTFLGAGSQAEYGPKNCIISPDTETNPENGYGIAKLSAGQMTRIICRKNGIRHIWCRIFSVYGPYDAEYTMVMSGIIRMLKSENPQYTKGEQKWDYLFCNDAARALYLAALKGTDGSIYCVGGGTARPLQDYILEIRNAANPNCQPEIGAVPYSENQVMYLCADISSLTSDTGFVPLIDFKNGIEETVKFCKDMYINTD